MVTFVINAGMLVLTARIDLDYRLLGAAMVEEIVNACIGNTVIGIVSAVLGWFLPD